MQRRYDKIFSSALGREMEMLTYGHNGAPIIAFPSWGSRFYEWEDNEMVNTLAPLLSEGKIRLYCVDSIDNETWLHKRLDPHWRAVQHTAYQQYIIDQLIPYIRVDCEDEEARIATVGCDLGAYHAVNFTLKFPELFHYTLGMSGVYDIDTLIGEKSESLEIYYNNPLAYLPNLEGTERDRVKDNTHIAIVCGEGAWDERSLSEAHRLHEQLEAKKVSCELDVWGYDVTPDWYWWRKQLIYHINKKFSL